MLNRYLCRTTGIRWRKIISNKELWEATGKKPIILQIRMRWVAHTQGKGDEYTGVGGSFGLESAGSQKDSKTEANLEKDSFVGSRKMRQNTERV